MKTLTLNNLEIKYSTPSKENLVICKELNLQFNQGEIIGVFGPNGSGKTSLLRALLKLKELASGNITYLETITKKEKNPKKAYIPQGIQNSFFSWLDLKNNILMASKEEKSLEHFLSLWSDFGITFKSSLRPSDCSGGMLQQAAIIRAFINKPDIIIGDEPFSALDVSTAGRVRSIFREKVKDKGVIAVLALHNLDDLLCVCDKIVFIPNKPYSSKEKPPFHQIKVFKNPHVDGEEVSDKERSLAHTLEQLFN